MPLLLEEELSLIAREMKAGTQPSAADWRPLFEKESK